MTCDWCDIVIRFAELVLHSVNDGMMVVCIHRFDIKPYIRMLLLLINVVSDLYSIFIMRCAVILDTPTLARVICSLARTLKTETMQAFMAGAFGLCLS